MATACERRLQRVVEHIHDHPAGDLSLDALADVAAPSRFHFRRVSAAGVGETAAYSPVFKVYPSSPMDTPPDALVTEICLPLR